MDAYAWEPTPERIEQANVTRLMRAAGVATIDELRRKSVEDIDWYWDLVVKDLGLPFDEPYTAVRDSSRGIEWTTWFVGGRLNVATACVDRWRADPATAGAPAVIHEDEAGAVTTLTYAELGAAVDRAAAGLRAAGIRPGDLLLECGGREIRPPEDLNFSIGESANLLVEKLHGSQQIVKVNLPMPKSKKHPVTAPQAVHSERLTYDIGLLKVAMFPGAIGIDVAKDIDRGIAALEGCSRLIVDLRGNTGGGIGGLRLMSYLTPGKLEVGYSLTRKRRERGYRREELTRFGRIPSHKSTLLWLAARYAFVEKSILVVTEGLGPRKFHGRVVLLVNEHTASAGEMVSAFAEENNLAVITGTKTPGRLLSGSAFKVGHGYILGLPVAAYLTWQGRMLENNGIVPKFQADLSRDALREGRDTQLETAVEIGKNM